MLGWHVHVSTSTPHNCCLVSSKFRPGQELKDLVRRLLCKQPLRRLGAKGAAEVRRHPWFAKFDWRGLGKRSVRAPYIPKVCSVVWCGCVCEFTRIFEW